MTEERIDIPAETGRGYTHQNWDRCLTDVGGSLGTLANDMYKCWNHRHAPQHSTVLALRYMRLELDSALHYAKREVEKLKEENDSLRKRLQQR